MATKAAPPAAVRCRTSRSWSVSGILRAEFLRFVAVGLVTSATYGVVFLLLGSFTDAPHLVINVAATADSTVLGNELNRRFTFRAGAAGSVARGQSAGLGMAAIGLLVSSLVLTGWQWISPEASDLSTLLVVYATTGLIGIANFAVQHTVLRGRSRPAPADGQVPGGKQVAVR
jgi:putative flippase GtrA